METLGIILGLACGVVLTSFYYKQRKEKILKSQSVLLIERIKQVCKLITVEGEFSELFTHQDEKNIFFKLIQFKKKALLIIKSKVLIGFDLSKINIEIDSDKKKVFLTHFPTPEILSIDNDLEYYDIQKGMISKFSENDLNNLNKKSREFIQEKVKESDLFLIAQNQAKDTVSVIRELIESVGWQLEADSLQLEQAENHKALKGNDNSNS